MTVFIDLIELDKGEECRSSTLITLNYKPKGFKVLGVLPHGYSFRPKTASDRNMMVEYLNQLEYKA